MINDTTNKESCYVSKLAVCDDSLNDCNLIKSLIEQYLFHNNINAEIIIISSSDELLKGDYKNYDLLFLDIFFGDKNGIEIAKQFREEGLTTPIVFITTSRDFAVESYDVNALYYILKPPTYPRVEKALSGYFNSVDKLSSVTFKVGRNDETIPLSDIKYVEASLKHCIIHTKSQVFEANISLSDFYEMLPKNKFIKPIRYAIVAFSEIKKIPSKEVELSDGTVIPISRSMIENVKERFFDYRMQMLRTSKIE